MLLESIAEVLIVSFILNLRNSHRATESARSCWGLTCRLQSSLKNTKKHVWLTKREKFHTALVFKQMQDVRVWCAAATHREQLEERILENLPLLVLIGDHGNVDFAEILREEEDQTHRAVRGKSTKKIKRRDKTLWSDSASPHYSFTFLTLWLNLRIFHKFAHINMHPCSLQAPLVFQRRSFWNVCRKLYIIISPSLTKCQVNRCVYVFFFFFSCQSDWIVSNSKRFDRPGRDWIPRFPLWRALQPRKFITWSHDPRRSDTRKTDRIVDRERRVKLVARLLKPIGIRFVLILQHSHKELTTGCKKTCKENKVTLPPPIRWKLGSGQFHTTISSLFFFFCLLLLLLPVNIQSPNLDHCYNDPTGKSCQLRPRTRWTFGWTRPNQIHRVSDINHMSHLRPTRRINSIHPLYAAHKSLKGVLLS